MQALHRPGLHRTPDAELWLDRMADLQNQSSANGTELSRFSNLEDINLLADGTLELRVMISIVYSVVCAVGLVGNLLVFFLMKVRQGRKKSTINYFIMNLAVTDFQFVLTLPFWAVDTALDFTWPFGHVMCKVVVTVTVMNVYASAFFLTAMSVTRYWSVASALKDRTRNKRCSVKLVSALLWLLATAASVPTAIFSTVSSINGVKLCLLRFPQRPALARSVSPAEDPCGVCVSDAHHRRVLPSPVAPHSHAEHEQQPPQAQVQSHQIRHDRGLVLLLMLAAQPRHHLLGSPGQV